MHATEGSAIANAHHFISFHGGGGGAVFSTYFVAVIVAEPNLWVEVAAVTAGSTFAGEKMGMD